MLKYQQSRPWSTWGRRRVGWRTRAALLLALAAALALRVRVTGELSAELRAPPHKLAAHLADFNSLRLLYPHISSWKLESQWTNYTSWRYSLSFSCGARCVGAAHVRAHDEYASGPAHGSAQAHRGDFSIQTCRTLPLLFWPDFCEELEVEWFVGGGAAGADGAAGAARYAERARSRRALGAALLGWLGGGGLADARADHLRALRETVH
ncbi:uncharacterized protein LOC133522467 isoform X2 [Cydia pomonella]|uniref:uncharacterized protein LOC133522467 isoform X2 n=1 Tax=Cydia pomonella TaxID=82600 RepID=UPI002ADD74A0|nr:uncharacterized protein LOC133522467 isoform X2 [Cydia pomonella]